MIKIKYPPVYRYNNCQGFSLLELIVVVAIIGILSSIAIYAYSGYTDKARISSGMSILQNLKAEAAKSYLENGSFPTIPDQTNTAVPYTDDKISNSKIVAANSYATMYTNVIGYVQITFSSDTSIELRNKVLGLVAIENETILKWQCMNGDENGNNTINPNLLPKICQTSTT